MIMVVIVIVIVLIIIFIAIWAPVELLDGHVGHDRPAGAGPPLVGVGQVEEPVLHT